MIKSKALEINLARTQVDVAIDPRFDSLRAVMARYHGLLEGLNSFLKEVSHPYKNWQFIIVGARGYALDYFHLMRAHPLGVEAAQSLLDIFFDALAAETSSAVKVDAADNLILFLQRIVRPAQLPQEHFQRLVNRTLDRIRRLPGDLFGLFVRSYYALKRLARSIAETPDGYDCTAVNQLMARLLASGLNYWLSLKDPLRQFMDEAEGSGRSDLLERIFAPIAHQTLFAQRQRLLQLTRQGGLAGREVLAELCGMADHNEMVQGYRKIPQALLEGGGEGAGHQWKVLFLFQIMNIEGLSLIHEDVLRDINRTLHWLITHESSRNVTNLVQKTFSILKKNAPSYPLTALNSVLNMGKGIFQTDDAELIDSFIEAVIDLGFQSPQIQGVGNDWQIQANSAHIQNIRTWMELVQLRPKRARRLISNLIIQLAISGVFIRDTDLFGRDITRLLNSGIGPVYNLIKQLARLFPVYFNDIGAEGELRDISTRIDEICHRRDPLIHFLRKQSHVEGSNRILNLMEAALQFWATRDKTVLQPFLPPNIYAQIDTRGLYIDGVHEIVRHLVESGVEMPAGLLSLDAEALTRVAAQVGQATAVDQERMVLFSEFYKQLNQKYNLDFKHLRRYVDQLHADLFPQLSLLKEALREVDLKERIAKLLDYLELLKSIIVSPQAYEMREDIYKKRHFTVDIPSMYGSYRELKFDAMGLTLRIEALLNVLFEELIDTIDLSFITKATCHQISDRLKLFDRALKADGIASAELERELDLLSHSLEIRGFSFTQYQDIFKGFAQAVRNVINDYFNNIHGEHLTRILTDLPAERLLEKYRPDCCGLDADPERVCHRTSEIFFRDRLATSLGLQQLDLFLSRIHNTLFNQSDKLPNDKLRLLLSYDPDRVITTLHNPNPAAGSIIYLGNKGLNLVKLKQFGLPVPPGFIITTEVFRCREIVDGFPPATDNFKDQVVQNIRVIEEMTGKRFGDPDNPLLLSVRSGSSISQPGMMDTFLNVGINERIARGLAAQSGNAWFAWDSYRRFLQGYGMGLGMQRDDFDAIIDTFKKKLGMQFKKEFSGAHMQEVALSYKERIQTEGFTIPDDPLVQLFTMIRSVIDSWESDKAKTYRLIMGISDDWGTAITVQAMVFGNLSGNSGSGVIFTHNPRWPSEDLSLWGDFTLENQGEDVVAGLVKTLPISVKQQEIEMRETDVTLETHFPRIFQTMRSWAHELTFQRGWSPQEMEFTFESPDASDLHMLQTRDMAIREHKRVLAFDPEYKKEQAALGHGIGVSAGAMSGRLVFSLEEVEHWRKKEPHAVLILVRGDTVPDDIKEINATDGLLTARGGVTSHAAVVAHRLGKTCVVGCGNMICDERQRMVHFGDHQLRSGEYISIDGREGSVYQGNLKIKET
ncbi:MAG: pyruvate, phosphate dikinase [Desulfobacteraceae bacterium]|nr:MAG: pyruvate, phosphate dikinase [Desulfobacteraceae bacterium]